MNDNTFIIANEKNIKQLIQYEQDLFNDAKRMLNELIQEKQLLKQNFQLLSQQAFLNNELENNKSKFNSLYKSFRYDQKIIDQKIQSQYILFLQTEQNLIDENNQAKKQLMQEYTFNVSNTFPMNKMKEYSKNEYSLQSNEFIKYRNELYNDNLNDLMII
jgi:hypothetical protein